MIHYFKDTVKLCSELQGNEIVCRYRLYVCMLWCVLLVMTLLLAFFQQYFGDDHAKQFIYKEPKITNLTEITQRLLKLYSRKFGPDTVCILKESGKVRHSTFSLSCRFSTSGHCSDFIAPYFLKFVVDADTV